MRNEIMRLIIGSKLLNENVSVADFRKMKETNHSSLYLLNIILSIVAFQLISNIILLRNGVLNSNKFNSFANYGSSIIYIGIILSVFFIAMSVVVYILCARRELTRYKSWYNVQKRKCKTFLDNDEFVRKYSKDEIVSDIENSLLLIRTSEKLREKVKA